jgi:hypothetical protein
MMMKRENIMLKIKNTITGLCLLAFAGISVNAVAGTSAAPQDQVNNQTAIVKAVNQSDSIQADDLLTDAVIGSEISVDDYNLILAQHGSRLPRHILNRFPTCPRCGNARVPGTFTDQNGKKTRINPTVRGCKRRGILRRCSNNSRS